MVKLFKHYIVSEEAIEAFDRLEKFTKIARNGFMIATALGAISGLILNLVMEDETPVTVMAYVTVASSVLVIVTNEYLNGRFDERIKRNLEDLEKIKEEKK